VQHLRLVILWAVPNTLQQHKLCVASDQGSSSTSAGGHSSGSSEVGSISNRDPATKGKFPPSEQRMQVGKVTRAVSGLSTT
jgi:hypothetical protein